MRVHPKVTIECLDLLNIVPLCILDEIFTFKQTRRKGTKSIGRYHNTNLMIKDVTKSKGNKI